MNLFFFIQGFLGLSGAILVQLYHTFFDANPSSFILMLAILPSSLSLILMYFIDVCPKTDSGAYDNKFLDAFSLIALCLAGYLMLVIIGQSLFTYIPSILQFAIFGVLMVFLGSLLAIVTKADKESNVLDEITRDERVSLVEDNKNYGEVVTSGTQYVIEFTGKYTGTSILIKQTILILYLFQFGFCFNLVDLNDNSRNFRGYCSNITFFFLNSKYNIWYQHNLFISEFYI